ncbi:CCAAT/enhancer-binding protein [Drosophila novamexicana]|uniref:CCAAT/enhancer-binding protein n=1 Tax=Drosophila novamexicana TaxID=47314 RepID=UPI0011E5FCEE|nr:CCAAT/enhancer-binding protein [Drosophila novamexicana]
MGSCCSKDLDDKRSWSPEETKNGSTTSTIIAQPMDDVGSTGVFTLTRTTTTTTTTTTKQQQQQQKQQQQEQQQHITANAVDADADPEAKQ